MDLNSIVLKHFYKNKKLSISIIINLIAYIYLDIIFPKNSSIFIDNIDKLNFQSVWKTLFPLFFSQICFYISDNMYTKAIVDFEDDIFNDVIQSVVQSKQTDINKLDIINNLGKIFEIKNIIHLLVAYFLPTIMVSIALLFYFYNIDKKLGITFLGILVVSVVIMNFLVKKSIGISEKRDKKNQEFLNEVDDILLNILKINHNDKNDEEINMLNDFKCKIKKYYIDSHDFNTKIKAIVAVVSLFILLILSGMLISLYKQQKITKGNLITYLYMVLLLLQYYDITSYEIDTLLYYVGDYEQARKYFSQFSKKDEIYMSNMDITGNIQIKNLTIQMKDKKIMENVTISIPANKKIGIVGDIGTGKSSLLKAIMKIYPYEGDIFIDNVNVNKLNVSKVVSYIPQTIHYFNRTIYHNLVYGNKKSKEEVQEYIKEYGLEDFMKVFPKGLDTEIVKNGENISGGQRQILELLKVLMDNKRIVLMDEPTASLSMNYKNLFIDILNKIHDKTILIVTHDESLYPFMDEIVIVR